MQKSKDNSYDVRKISVGQMSLVKGLLEGAAIWLKGQQIDQWGHLLTNDEDQEIREAILKGETYVVYKNDQPAATFNLNMNPSEWDKSVWGDIGHDAIYLHRLTVDRDYAGQNISGFIFQWVLDNMNRSGKAYLRLDCVGHNEKLNGFYKKQGFDYIGVSSSGFSKYQKPFVSEGK